MNTISYVQKWKLSPITIALAILASVYSIGGLYAATPPLPPKAPDCKNLVPPNPDNRQKLSKLGEYEKKFTKHNEKFNEVCNQRLPRVIRSLQSCNYVKASSKDAIKDLIKQCKMMQSTMNVARKQICEAFKEGQKKAAKELVGAAKNLQTSESPTEGRKLIADNARTIVGDTKNKIEKVTEAALKKISQVEKEIANWQKGKYVKVRRSAYNAERKTRRCHDAGRKFTTAGWYKKKELNDLGKKVKKDLKGYEKELKEGVDKPIDEIASKAKDDLEKLQSENRVAKTNPSDQPPAGAPSGNSGENKKELTPGKKEGQNDPENPKAPSPADEKGKEEERKSRIAKFAQPGLSGRTNVNQEVFPENIGEEKPKASDDNTAHEVKRTTEADLQAAKETAHKIRASETPHLEKSKDGKFYQVGSDGQRQEISENRFNEYKRYVPSIEHNDKGEVVTASNSAAVKAQEPDNFGLGKDNERSPEPAKVAAKPQLTPTTDDSAVRLHPKFADKPYGAIVPKDDGDRTAKLIRQQVENSDKGYYVTQEQPDGGRKVQFCSGAGSCVDKTEKDLTDYSAKVEKDKQMPHSIIALNKDGSLGTVITPKSELKAYNEKVGKPGLDEGATDITRNSDGKKRRGPKVTILNRTPETEIRQPGSSERAEAVVATKPKVPLEEKSPESESKSPEELKKTLKRNKDGSYTVENHIDQLQKYYRLPDGSVPSKEDLRKLIAEREKARLSNRGLTQNNPGNVKHFGSTKNPPFEQEFLTRDSTADGKKNQHLVCADAKQCAGYIGQRMRHYPNMFPGKKTDTLLGFNRQYTPSSDLIGGDPSRGQNNPDASIKGGLLESTGLKPGEPVTEKVPGTNGEHRIIPGKEQQVAQYWRNKIAQELGTKGKLYPSNAMLREVIRGAGGDPSKVNLPPQKEALRVGSVDLSRKEFARYVSQTKEQVAETKGTPAAPQQTNSSPDKSSAVQELLNRKSKSEAGYAGDLGAYNKLVAKNDEAARAVERTQATPPVPARRPAQSSEEKGSGKGKTIAELRAMSKDELRRYLGIIDKTNPKAAKAIGATQRKGPVKALISHHTETPKKAWPTVDHAINYGHRKECRWYKGRQICAPWGYSYYIGQDGKIYQARPDNERTNHIGRKGRTIPLRLANRNTVGFAFEGLSYRGKSGSTWIDRPLSQAELNAARGLTVYLEKVHNSDRPLPVYTHSEVNGTNHRKNSEGIRQGQLSTITRVYQIK